MKNSRGSTLESLHGRVVVQFQLGSIGTGPVRNAHFHVLTGLQADAPKLYPPQCEKIFAGSEESNR